MVSHSFSSCWHLQVVESQQQRGIRRRCLVFEAAGGFSNSAVKKGTIEDRSVSTCSKGKSPAQSQPRGLRGIGLHLNALALTPKGKMASACQDPPPTASALLPSSASGKDARGELLCAGENFAHSGGELLEFPLDDCSAGSGGFPVNDHHVSGQSVSPQKKRFVFTSVSAWNGRNRNTATISLHFNSLKTILVQNSIADGKQIMAMMARHASDAAVRSRSA